MMKTNRVPGTNLGPIVIGVFYAEDRGRIQCGAICAGSTIYSAGQTKAASERSTSSTSLRDRSVVSVYPLSIVV